MQIQWKNYGNFRGERQKKNQLCRFGVCIHIFWLGCSCGLLVAVTLDAMYLENENVQKVIHAPVVAFSGEDSSAFGDCQMILHPNLIDS